MARSVILSNDPSRTGLLRSKSKSVIEAKFKSLTKALRALLNEPGLFSRNQFTFNSWSFLSSEEKIAQFENWISSKLSEIIEAKDSYSGVDWWQEYITRAYTQGTKRVFENRTNNKPGAVKQGISIQFGNSLGSPIRTETLKLLVGRTFKDLKGLNEQARAQLGQILIEGLLNRTPVSKIANQMVKRLKITKSRANTILRTEIVRAQAEGQLAALKAFGVSKVGVEVEFLVTKNACPKCQKLAGKIFPIEKASGIIPVHPNCRCSFIPHVEIPKRSKLTKLEQKLLGRKSK